MSALLLLAFLVQQPAAAAQRTGAPCVYWTQGVESRATLESAGIKRLCVPPDQAGAWQDAGFDVTAVTPAEIAAREVLPAPGITARAGIASPTRAPWIDAGGWKFLRNPAGKYVYDVPAGKAPLAAAEAYAYGADVVLKIDPADVTDLGTMLKFLESLPPFDLPAIADIGLVDDGSFMTGEVMNLLVRRNLLFQVVKAPSQNFSINVVIGSKEYSKKDAADPSAFALKIRRQLTDEKRTVRIYGSEVVICRLAGTGERIRLHLINYGGREVLGLRVRLRGKYQNGEVRAAGVGSVPLADYVDGDTATEFSIPRMLTYAVIDLNRVK